MVQVEGGTVRPALDNLGGDVLQKQARREQMRSVFETKGDDGEWKERMSTMLFILFCVIVNATVDTWAGAHPEPGSTEAVVRFVVGLVCLLVYFAEMLLKMHVYGLICDNGYFRSSWSVLEFFVVVAGVVDAILIFSGSRARLQFMRALRVIKIFKLGKCLKKLEHVHIMLSAYILCLKRSMGVLICTVFFNLCFAVIGLTLFGGNGQMQYFCTLHNTTTDVRDTDASIFLVMPPRHCQAPAERAHRVFLPADGRKCIEPLESCEQMKDIPPLDGLHSFDRLSESVMTLWTLLSHDQDRFMVLETIDANGMNVPAVFFFACTVAGSIILYNYFTAIFVLSYMEILGRFEMQDVQPEDFAMMRIGPPGQSEFSHSDAQSLASFLAHGDKRGQSDSRLESVTEQVQDMWASAVRHVEQQWKRAKKQYVVAKLLRGCAHVCVFLASVVVHPNEVRKGDRQELERNLPRKTSLDALISLVTILQVAVMCAKHPALSASEVRMMEIIDSLCIWFFLVVLIIKLAAYGDPRPYLSLKVNIFDCVLTTVSVIAWMAEGVDESESNQNLSAVRICRVVRVLSLARYFPGVYALITDTVSDSSQTLSTLFVVFFSWLIYSLVGRQVFEGILLPPVAFPGGEQNFEAMGKVAYFDSIAGTMFFVLMLMTGTNISSSMVDANQSVTGKVLVVFLLVGGIVLELVIMKTFLAVLIDNFESNDKDKILSQLYAQDKAARLHAEERRFMLIVSAMGHDAECHFNGYSFSKKIQPVGFGASTQTKTTIVLQSWAYVCLHTSEDPGKRVWLELLDNGVISCWDVAWTAKQQGTWIRTHECLQIPVRNAEVVMQSSMRVRAVLQAGSLSFVVRADCADHKFANITELHQEHVIFVSSHRLLQKWIETLAVFGARVSKDVGMQKLDKGNDFGWDSLINRHAGFGFNDSIDESLVPGPKPLPEARRKDSSRGLAQRIECAAKEMVEENFMYKETEIEKELKAQSRLGKHELLRHIFTHRHYEACSVFVVALVILFTALDPDTDEALIPQAAIERGIVEVAFLVVFFLDVLLKNVTLGVAHPLCLGSVWGWMDLAVLCFMFTSVVQSAIATASGGISAIPLRVVRLLRCIRPIVLIPRMKRVRQSVECLFNAWDNILRVTVLILLLTLTAGTMGLEIFSGRMVYCTSTDDFFKHECVGAFATRALDKEMGVLSWDHLQQHVPEQVKGLILAPRSWHRTRLNFDDFGNVMRVVSLIAMPPSTNWAILAEDAIRVQGFGDMSMHPTGSGFEPVLLIGITIMLLHMLLFSLLTAVLIKHLRETNGLAVLTSAQRAWNTTLRLITRSASIMNGDRLAVSRSALKPKDGDGARTPSCGAVQIVSLAVLSPKFTQVFDVLILANVFFLSLQDAESFKTNNALQMLIRPVGMLLALGMAAEQAMLLLHHGPALFRSPMSACDFGVVLFGLAEALIHTQASCLLVLRMPRLILSLAGLREYVPQLAVLHEVLQSYWHSLKNSAGTLLVLAIWIIMFAIIGLDFFGGCKYDRYHINGQTNFDTIQSSLELMFRISVGGDYVGVADSISIQPPFCTPDPFVQGNVEVGGRFDTKLVIPDIGKYISRNGDCGRPGAWWFLLTFVIVTRLCIMPMLIATVVSALIEKMDDRRSLISWEAILEFEDVWSAFDPEKTGHLSRWKLKAICEKLKYGKARIGQGHGTPCILGLPLLQPEHEGGVSFDALYLELKFCHDSAFESQRSSSREKGSDPMTQQQESAWHSNFRYELVLRQMVAIYALRQALPTMDRQWHGLVHAVDRLYGRVTDQHLHRLLDAMAHIEATLHRVAKPQTSLSATASASNRESVDLSAFSGQTESLTSFMHRMTSTENHPSHVQHALVMRRNSYSLRAFPKEKATETFSQVLRVLRRRIYIHIAIKTPKEEKKQTRRTLISSQDHSPITPVTSSPTLLPAPAYSDHERLSPQAVEIVDGSLGEDATREKSPGEHHRNDSEKHQDDGHVPRDGTFVLLCKGSCTSGQTGILYDREAENFIDQMKSRDCGEVWVLTPQDFVVKGMPTRTARFSALRSIAPTTPRELRARSEPDTPVKFTKDDVKGPQERDEWTGTLTDIDTNGNGLDTLATFIGSPGAGIAKQELPFMKEWQDRQSTARSTGSSLSLASHVIPESFLKLGHQFTILQSLPEYDALSRKDNTVSEPLTERSWLDNPWIDLQSLGIGSVAGRSELGSTVTSTQTAPRGEEAEPRAGMLSFPWASVPKGPKAYFPSANEPTPLVHSSPGLQRTARTSVSFAAVDEELGSPKGPAYAKHQHAKQGDSGKEGSGEGKIYFSRRQDAQ